MLTTKGSGATEAVANIADLLRNVQVEGVTPLKGKYSGFSIRDEEDQLEERAHGVKGMPGAGVSRTAATRPAARPAAVPTRRRLV